MIQLLCSRENATFVIGITYEAYYLRLALSNDLLPNVFLRILVTHLVKSSNYGAAHCVFYSVLTIRLSCGKLLSSVPCSQPHSLRPYCL
jgi:hypothetical protein